MKNTFWVKALLVIVGIFAGYWVITKLLGWIVGTLLFKIVLPVVVVGAIGYVGYRYVTRSGSALPGRRRSPLP